MEGRGAIQEQSLFNIMAYGGQLFWGSGCQGVTYTNRIQIQKDVFFFLNPGDGHICKAHQSNVFEITPGGLIDLW